MYTFYFFISPWARSVTKLVPRWLSQR